MPSKKEKLKKDLKKIDEVLLSKDAGKSEEQIETGFKEINKEIERQNQEYKDTVNKKNIEEVERLGLGKGLDNMRYINKKMLENYSQSLLTQNKTKNTDVQKLLEAVKEYSLIDVTASTSTAVNWNAANPNQNAEKNNFFNSIKIEMDKEISAYENIVELSGTLFNLLEDKLAEVDPNEKKVLTELENDISIVSNILMYFEGQRNGNLEPIPDDAKVINAKGKKIVLKEEGGGRKNVSISAKDVPLFPHDPSPNDLKQGSFGDCYLLSGLSQLAERHPEKIKDMIRDNEDGTVTVRFFSRKYDPKKGPGVADTFEPVYVTVDKMVMSDKRMEGAKYNLWAQMIERAYIASGLEAGGRITDEIQLSNGQKKKRTSQIAIITRYNQPVPDNIDQLYNVYRKLPQAKWPSHTECPWLIDEEGNLHPFERNMTQIEGSSPGLFLEHVLGSEAVSELTLIKEESIPHTRYLPETAIALWKNEVEANGQTLSEEEINRSLDDLTQAFIQDPFQGVEKVKQFMYSKLTGNTPVLDQNGSMIVDPDEIENRKLDIKQNIIDAMVNDIVDGSVNQLRLDLAAGKGIEVYKLSELFSGLYDDKNTKKITKNEDPARTQNRKIYIKKYPQMVKSWVSKIERAMENAAMKMDDEYHPVRFSGMYTQSQKSVYDQIEKAHKAGQYITASSKRDVDESMGMIPTHAYSVTRCFSKVVEGKEVKFVEVRNPWGNLGIKYENTILGPKPVSTLDVKGGIFELELTDFCSMFKNFMINKEAPSREGVLDANIFDIQCVKGYGSAMQEIVGQLADTNAGGAKARTSQEYIAFNEAAKNFNNMIQYIAGYKVENIKDTNEFKALKEATNKYLIHCQNDPKTISPRRTSRIKAAQNAQKLIENLENNVREPKEHELDKIAEKFVNEFSNILKHDKDPVVAAKGRNMLRPNVKEMVKDKFKNSDIFKKAFDGRTFSEVVKAGENGANKLVKMFMKATTFHKDIETEMNRMQAASQIAQPSIENPQLNVPGNSIISH